VRRDASISFGFAPQQERESDHGSKRAGSDRLQIDCRLRSEPLNFCQAPTTVRIIGENAMTRAFRTCGDSNHSSSTAAGDEEIMRIQTNFLNDPRRVTLAAILLSFLLLVPSMLCARSAHALDPGDDAPTFAAPALQSGAIVDLAEFRGKVVLLDFWASWCAPCLKSLPNLEALRGEFSDTDFRVVAVNVDQEPDKALRFLAKKAIHYPSVSDPKGDITERFDIAAMPTTYLIDRDGVVRYVHEGFERGDEKTLRTQIEWLLRMYR
jgi:peroxiredoxin